MPNFLKQLFADLFTDVAESTLSPLFEKMLDKAGYIVLGVAVLAFWYSGFADYQHFAQRGFFVFALPAAGILLAVTLFAIGSHLVMKHDVFFAKAWLCVTVMISLPFIIPFLFMLAVREKDLAILAKASIASTCAIAILALVIGVLERQEAWRTATKIAVLMAVVLLAWSWSVAGPDDLLGLRGTLDKYEPLRAARHLLR